jgi:hypothetical protein
MAWAVAGLVALGNAFAIWGLGWTVHPKQVLAFAIEIGALAVIGWRYRSRQLYISRLGFSLALLFTCAVLAQLTTYTTTLLRAPLVDTQLRAMDTALGFDWFAAWDWLYAHRPVYHVAGLVYETLVVQSVVTVAVLAFRPEGTTAFLRAYGLAFLVTVAVASSWPALGTVSNGPAAVVTLALREGRLHELDLFAPVGIISMPSFHATGAVLTAIAFWPVRSLRLPVVLYEGVMVAATVPMGAHYLVDVIAGVALAFMAASVTRMPAMGLVPRGSL